MNFVEARRGLKIDGSKAFCLTRSNREKTPIFWYQPNFLSATEEKELFGFLDARVVFSDEKSFYGHPPARQSVYWGDQDYVYSGKLNKAQEMPKEVAIVRDSVRDLLNRHPSVGQTVSYRSVLVNKYRDERDSICKHSDDPTNLVKGAPIAGVNVGSPRVLSIFAEHGVVVRVSIRPGSLYWFYPEIPHAIDKGKEPGGVRYNLTFREHKE